MIFSMYDWNHNGKHDSFDDAMFMALLVDDLEKNPPAKRKRSSSSQDDNLGCAMGCGFAVCIFSFILLSLLGF